MNKIFFWVMFLIGLFLLLKFLFRLSLLWAQFCIYKKKNFKERYGEESYVIITGASSGQGRQFAYQFAQSGLNLILIGSKRTYLVKSTIQERYPDCKIVIIEKDFSDAFEKGFFDPIEEIIKKHDVSILVNNVGYRTGWLEYENMPILEIKKCLAVCTMVQSVMTQIAMRHFKWRHSYFPEKSCAIINNTAQCLHHTDFLAFSPEISIPFLSVYEASKAFDYFHSNSVQKEIEERMPYVDFLTITPGAVITDTTKEMLEHTIFSITDTRFVSNVLTALGNTNGVICGSFGHAISGMLINLFPFIKRDILYKVGKNIATQQQNRIEKESFYEK